MASSFNLSRTSLLGAAFLGTCGLYFVSRTIYNSFFAEKSVKQEALVKQFSDLKKSFEEIKRDYLTKDKVTVEELSSSCSETQVVLSPLLADLRALSLRVNKLYNDNIGSTVVYAEPSIDEAFPYAVTGLLSEASQLLSTCQRSEVAKFAPAFEHTTTRFASFQARLSEALLEEKPALLKEAQELHKEIQAFHAEISTDPITREPSAELFRIISAIYTMIYQSEQLLNEINYATAAITNLEKYKAHNPISVYYPRCQNGDIEHIRDYVGRVSDTEQAPIAPFDRDLEVYIRGEELAELPSAAHQGALDSATEALTKFDAENPDELSVDEKIEKAISFLGEKGQWGGDEIIRTFMAWAHEVKGLNLSIAVLGTDESDVFVKRSASKKEISPQVGEEHLFKVLMTHDYLDRSILGLDEDVCVREEGVTDIVLWNQNQTHFHLFTEPVARFNQKGEALMKTMP